MTLGRIAMQGSAERIRAVKALPVNVAILDRSGTVVDVNKGWKEFGRLNGMTLPVSGVGSKYLDYCDPTDANQAGFAGSLIDLLDGKLDLLTYVYPCHSPRKKRWFAMLGMPISMDRPTLGVALLHVNFTEMLQLFGEQVSHTGGAASLNVHPIKKVGAISDAIEYSVLGSLTSQLAGMAAHAAANTEEPAAARRLTKRQKQVLHLLAKGRTNAEIADALGRSHNTIKLHVSAILKQLHIKNRTEAALLAAKFEP